MPISLSANARRCLEISDDTRVYLQVNVPKTRRTYCKKCKKHQPHKVTQYKKGKDSVYAQGKFRELTERSAVCSLSVDLYLHLFVCFFQERGVTTESRVVMEDRRSLFSGKR